MKATGGLTGRMVAASAALALLVAGGFVVLLLAIGDLRGGERKADHTQQELVAANALERVLLDVETGQRGYAITHMRAFLEPWVAARRSFPAKSRRLVRLAADNREEARQAATIVAAVRSYIEDYSVPLVRAAERGLPSAMSIASTVEGKRLVDALRADFDRLIATEQATAQAASARVSTETTRAIWVAAVSIAGSVALIALYAGYLARAIVRPVRRAARMAGRLAGGDLSARVPETSVGELGELEQAFNVMGGSLEEARDELHRVAAEQAALRRVATLVARRTPPREVFAAVAVEVGAVIPAVDFAMVCRYEGDEAVEVVGVWTPDGDTTLLGRRTPLGGENVSTLVFRRHEPVRVERFDGAEAITDAIRRFGIRSSAGAPISVEGVLWGAMIVASTRERALPPGTEERLAEFTELVAAAIANTQAREELGTLAEEQAALRRVATLVAQGAPPEIVFQAVADEAGKLLAVDSTLLGRYDGDGFVAGLAGWGPAGRALVGARAPLAGDNVASLVHASGRPARVRSYEEVHGEAGEIARGAGLRTAAGAPVEVGGRVWGILIGGTTTDAALPADTEERLTRFADLAATAVANAQARGDLSRVAAEQAALRRVATRVAEGAPPPEVFASVAEEVGLLLPADGAFLGHFEEDGRVTIVAAWNESAHIPLGFRGRPGQDTVSARVRETGLPARVDAYDPSIAEELGIRSAVGAPVTVAGRIWGTLAAVSTRPEALAPETEERLAGFAFLVATAIANAESQKELSASRARIVASADETRRRIERDLHDGAQQRLVSLALELRAAQAAVPPELGELARELDGVATGLNGALEELREFARGIHPAILAEGGLVPALRTLARRSPVPVELDLHTDGRLPEAVEVGAYFVVSEALANAAKHADATSVAVEVVADEGSLRIRVHDDGVGGAAFGGGSGLVGLKDRVEALGGRIALVSEPGDGTTLSAELPLGSG